MDREEIVKWLLEGDVSIQYQVHRDLLDRDRKELQNRIVQEGWGREFLSRRNPDGHWGQGFYQPKWISTHYTLLDLRNLNVNQNTEAIKETTDLVLKFEKAQDGGISLGPSTHNLSDICVNAMFLNYASYFKTEEQKLYSVVDSILNQIMPDGGFNCSKTRTGATHSSLHTTLSVLEGLFEFQKTGNTYRGAEIQHARDSAEEFVLLHNLFLSDRTGEVIKKDFLKLSYPCRWKYDILRGLDYFQYSGCKWDSRMAAAIDVIRSKRKADGRWNMPSAHPGQMHFVMEKAGKPGRWNTLRALRVFKHFNLE